jgi:hypothetical protein
MSVNVAGTAEQKQAVSHQLQGEPSAVSCQRLRSPQSLTADGQQLAANRCSYRPITSSGLLGALWYDQSRMM